MADTLPNIAIPTNQWVDLYALAELPVGIQISIENIGVCDVYITIQAAEPDPDHDSYTVIQRDNGEPYPVPAGAAGAWAFCTAGGKVNITKLILPDDGFQRSSFGELAVEEPVPIAQIVATRGLSDKVASFFVSGGSTASIDNMFESTTGTDPEGLGSVVTRRQATYRAGQGMMTRFTALFDTPQPNSIQHAGFITITDRFCFGYEGIDFGIIHVRDGELEIQELTVTVAAGGAEDATVTVDGTAFTVPLTVGSVEHNAFEIATSLSAQTTNYIFKSNQDQVVARALLPTLGGGLFAFTSATAVAAWDQITAAVIPTTDLIAQADWNVNKAPLLNPQKGNVYEIKIQYLGFGPIQFFVVDGSNRLVLVHVIEYQNENIRPSVGDPTFRTGWLVINDGNTTSITLKGASAGLFNEGKIEQDEPNRAFETINLSVPVQADPVNLLVLRNRDVFQGRQNRHELRGISLNASTGTAKAVFITAQVNAAVSGDLIFSYADKDKSIVEIATDPGDVTDGRLAASIIITSTVGAVLDLTKFKALLLAGGTIVIGGRISTGSSSEIALTLTWQEDL
jgi:hypothetical protein